MARSRWSLMMAGLALAVTPACSQTPPATSVSAVRPTLPTAAQSLAAMERVADWQLAHMGSLDHIPQARPSARNPRDWQQATFWVALTELADRSVNPRFKDAILSTGRASGWQLGARPYHADDHLIGQAWLWAADNGAGAEAIAPMRATFDAVIANPKTGSLEFVAKPPGAGEADCVSRWCWCDALFMAPATLHALSEKTGDQRYARFADQEFRAATDYLYDPAEHLYFRDSRFFERRGPDGEKLFWSRGNGWVMGGLARIIPHLPAGDPRRAYYVDLFRQMAARIVTLQRADGFWASSLLGDREHAPRESSGTGFYVYALAWGVNAGLLPRADYEPAILRGWHALQTAVQPDGKLGWVQQVSDRPDDVKADDTQFYGVGAFLLAGAEVHDMGLAAAPVPKAPAAPRQAAPPYATAVLNVNTAKGFRLLDRFDVPGDHAIHDGLIAFEGPGWESDKIAYRLYLDERNAIDIFGKKRPEPILAKIGIGKDDYHAMADWGMDIFKAGETLGAGGLGTLRGGRAEQLGPSRISARVLADGPGIASVAVDNRGWNGVAGPADLSATYSIAAGSRLTKVSAIGSDAATPIVAGLTLHPGVTIIHSPPGGAWHYVATYGAQSLAGDDLGIAIFYPSDSADAAEDGRTLYVRFRDPKRIRYAFGATWHQEPGAPQDVSAFRRWLDETAAGLGSGKK